jgi:hypothetical protein
LLAAGIAGYRVYSSRKFFAPRSLLSRFPAEDALALSVDFATLRAANLTGESKMTSEADYRQFVNGTGFDYKRDLDSVVASFSQSGNYFIARGRFDWKKLRDYTEHQGGSCYENLCRIQGSRPDRHISFLPLRNDAIAIAVSTNDLAATLLAKTGPFVDSRIPSAPVWISVPGSQLGRPNSLPPGANLMLSALSGADRITVTLGLAAQGIEARMEARCRTQEDAKLLAGRLRSTTTLLKEAVAREKNDADDVAALLSGGSFDQADRLVTGRWPVRKSLLDAITSGI